MERYHPLVLKRYLDFPGKAYVVMYGGNILHQLSSASADVLALRFALAKRHDPYRNFFFDFEPNVQVIGTSRVRRFKKGERKKFLKSLEEHLQ